MPEEKEIESSKEDEKVVDAEKQEQQKSEEESSQEGFVKDGEVVPVNKHNQMLRKLREAELEKAELAKKLAEASGKKEEVEEKEEDEFFKEEEPKVDPAKLIDEKLKPVLEANQKREENDKKIARTAFFEAHPEYLNDSEKWQELLDEMDRSLNPNSQDDYYTQLDKTHRILSGGSANVEVESKKKEIAGDAASGGDGAERASVKEEFTAEDRKYQKEWGISDEGLRAYKEKVKSGSLRILT